MIIDSNLILWEGPVAARAGNAIGLTSLHIPGKADPIPVLLRFTEDLAGATAVTVKLQQSDAADIRRCAGLHPDHCRRRLQGG